VGDAVTNNPAVPNEQNYRVIEEAGSSMMGSPQNMVSRGIHQSVMNLFHNPGNASSNPASQSISRDFIQPMSSKFGLDQ